jgi:hypothetical protein
MSIMEGGKNMPRRDGTGPLGRGAMSGRGQGFCTGNAGNRKSRSGVGRRLGLDWGKGVRKGWGRNMASGVAVVDSSKATLAEERKTLKNRLAIIDEQLKNL